MRIIKLSLLLIIIFRGNLFSSLLLPLPSLEIREWEINHKIEINFDNYLTASNVRISLAQNRKLYIKNNVGNKYQISPKNKSFTVSVVKGTAPFDYRLRPNKHQGKLFTGGETMFEIRKNTPQG